MKASRGDDTKSTQGVDRWSAPEASSGSRRNDDAKYTEGGGRDHLTKNIRMHGVGAQVLHRLNG